jgi:dipeptidyl-peptidase-4
MSTSGTGARPDTFPRQYARTRRFTLGEPRAFRIVEPGTCGDDRVRVLFLRSRGGSDPVGCLWVAVLDPAGEAPVEESVLVDPSRLAVAGGGDLPPEERARRERMRETSAGITAFATDRSGTMISFALAGSLVTHDLISAQTVLHMTAPGVVDPRVDPTGRRVAYLSGRSLRVFEMADGTDAELCTDPSPTVSWGAADFIAGEEHHRFRGFWWSPDGVTLLTQRTDEAAVTTWWVADPAHPDREPAPHRYPSAGTPNAAITLHLVDATGATRGRVIDVGWDRASHPYLTVASWNEHGPLMTVQDRAQQRERSLLVDPGTGAVTVLADVYDDRWIDVVPGTPALIDGRQLVATLDTHVAAPAAPGLTEHVETAAWPDPDGTRALAVHRRGGTTTSTLTPANLQIDRVLHCDQRRVVAAAHATRPLDGLALAPDPSTNAIVVVPLAADGRVQLLAGGAPDPGVHDATITWAAGADHPTMVVRSASIARTRAEITVLHGGRTIGGIVNLAEAALVDPAPSFHRLGPRGIPTAVLLPANHDPLVKLPVLLDPYGGPHGPRVLRSRNSHATSQWFADQGFAVVVADNRGVPGPGPEYEKAVRLDLASHAVVDQVDALEGAASLHPQLDLSRVAIRGWSFGGYLAAMCVLRRPDVFHAAVVGAPVTDWRLYDTAYTERYLGLPDEHPEAYERSSVLADASLLARPMMIVHGLADDNVVVAHSLRLSSALLASGRPHEVLPLSGVTHMTPQEDVAENLLLLQLAFLRRALGVVS